MSTMRIILIGNDRLARACAESLLARGHVLAALVTRDPALSDWARAAGVTCHAPDADLAAKLGALRSDWLLSIANFDILPPEVLALPRLGAVNFHDGPLPRHAGLNASVWALLAGETRHAITWHRMEAAIDTGTVLLTREVEIAPDDTALALNIKCLAAAIDSIPDLVTALESGAPDETPQQGARGYHGRDDRPAMQGWLDLAAPAETVARQVRALDHGGYPNPLCLPKLRFAGTFAAVGTAEVVAGGHAPGTVLAADAQSVTVACQTAAVRLSNVTDLRGGPLDPSRLIRPGETVPRPSGRDPSELARHEPFWRDALGRATPASLPTDGPPGGETRAHTLSCGDAAIALAGLLQRRADRGAGATLWVMDAASRDWAKTGLVSPVRPVVLPPCATIAEIAAHVPAALDAAAARASYALDLPLRMPGLDLPADPGIALSLGAGPVPGAAATVEIAEGRAVLHVDTGAVSSAAAAQLVAELETPAADPDAALSAPDPAGSPVLRGPDVTVPEATMASLFEAQVARTPDATALIFEAQHLDYAELDRRANRVAHVLRGMGVGPESIVGLCLPRGVALMVGALGILKAGGAYLPMDPAYPAERLAHFLADSAAPVVVTDRARAGALPPHEGAVLCLDTDPRLDAAPTTRPAPVAGPDDLAYVIYTSGSTGTPKGVMVTHRNVANFYAGMDRVVPANGDGDGAGNRAGSGGGTGTWLAVTSLSFDISVLELFYTTARGHTVVMASDTARALPSSGPPRAQAPGPDLSLYFWGSDAAPGPDAYRLMIEGAKRADAAGFRAVWTPERHFHGFGGLYPNPAVTGAALAAVTSRIDVRAGSCVAPLHHPARIAEEWAVIDTLTNGRAGLALASGWQPDDFVLRPENAPPANKTALSDTVTTLRRLWAGEAVAFPRGDGTDHAVTTYPRPVSRDLPLWLTTAGNPATWQEAGRLGVNVLTHLLGQSVAELGEKIALYRAALKAAGHDPDAFTVSVMLHTYLAPTRAEARAVAEAPMKRYLRSAAGLLRAHAWSFPAFRRPAGARGAEDLDLETLDEADMSAVLDHAFERYFMQQGLFGTVEDARARIAEMVAIGVGEIACLVDFGIPADTALAGLEPLSTLVETQGLPQPDAADDSIAGLIRRHGVTHLQCTPSMARLLAEDDGARAALGGIAHLFFGGEALPAGLVETFRTFTGARICNMYGPTETTIWSATSALSPETPLKGGTVALGTPIANTDLHVLDESGAPCAPGSVGELWIGGAGVTRGYLNRPELTAERFRDMDAAGRLYRTGDLVRAAAGGQLDFLGRVDHQIKIRGYRVEPGEIEARLAAIPGLRDAVVLARPDQSGALGLVAYLTGARPSDADLRRALAKDLPDHMIPARFVHLDAMPLTPNGKTDRGRLPDPDAAGASMAASVSSGNTRSARIAAPNPSSAPPGRHAPSAHGRAIDEIAAIWSNLLGVDEIAAEDNFFQLGGHSLLAVQAHRGIVEAFDLPALSIVDVFRLPTLAGLAERVSALGGTTSDPRAPAPAGDGGARADQRRAAMSRREAMRARRKAVRA